MVGFWFGGFKGKEWRKKKNNLGWRSVHRPQQASVCLSPWHHVFISQPWRADHLTFLAHCVATEHVLFSVTLDKLLLSHCAHNGHRHCSTGRSSTDHLRHGEKYMYIVPPELVGILGVYSFGFFLSKWEKCGRGLKAPGSQTNNRSLLISQFSPS